MRRCSGVASPTARCVLSTTLAILLLISVFASCATGDTAALQLEVRDGRKDALYYSTEMTPGDSFELHYIHSVSKSPVYGVFQVTQDASIQPLYTVYRAYGPGLPWPSDDHTRRDDGALQISHENELPRDELRVWVSPLTSDQLKLKDDVVELSAGSDEPRLVVIRLRN